MKGPRFSMTISRNRSTRTIYERSRKRKLMIYFSESPKRRHPNSEDRRSAYRNRSTRTIYERSRQRKLMIYFSESIKGRYTKSEDRRSAYRIESDKLLERMSNYDASRLEI